MHASACVKCTLFYRFRQKMSENLVQIGTWWNVWDIRNRSSSGCWQMYGTPNVCWTCNYDDTFTDVFRIPVSCDSLSYCDYLTKVLRTPVSHQWWFLQGCYYNTTKQLWQHHWKHSVGGDNTVYGESLTVVLGTTVSGNSLVMVTPS